MRNKQVRTNKRWRERHIPGRVSGGGPPEKAGRWGAALKAEPTAYSAELRRSPSRLCHRPPVIHHLHQFGAKLLRVYWVLGFCSFCYYLCSWLWIQTRDVGKLLAGFCPLNCRAVTANLTGTREVAVFHFIDIVV